LVSRVKKTKRYEERNEALRAKFREAVDNLPSEKIFFIDECGINQYLYREYGYAPKGQPVIGNVRGSKFKRLNIVAAKCVDRIVEPLVYDGTTDSVLFECWFENRLLKAIPKGSVLILDNATFHRKAKLRLLADRADCDVLFLPPYSPDLNPIEKFWAWLKQKLRDVLQYYDNLIDAVPDCFNGR
jgi:transposase